MKIVLMGYMGSGKTAMGKYLNRMLGLKTIDLDKYIEHIEEMSVSEIFRRYGEGGFREMECFHLRQIMADEDNFVLSLGGGTPCFKGNMDFLKGKCTSVYLSASPLVLAERLACSSTKRPLLKGKTGDELLEYVRQSLSQRERYYKMADFELSVETLSIDESGEALLRLIKENGIA